MNSRKLAEQIFFAGVESVLPDRLVKDHLSLRNNKLVISSKTFDLDIIENIYVIGAGKASAMMAQEVEKNLGKRITKGHIIVKYGCSCKLKYIKVTEAGHPVPDSNGFRATKAVMELAGKAGPGDLVICLLSGGGSSLLTDFPAGSSPEEMIRINDLLVNCGASIAEINAVRKHLSAVKGGQLARAVYPAELVSLILSDVPGDPIDVIASGPTAPDLSTFREAVTVLESFNLKGSVPPGLLKYLSDGIAGIRPETPKPADNIFERTQNILVGNNSMALEAASKKAMEYNINAVIIDGELQGDTSSVAKYIIDTSLSFQSDENEVKPICLLFGGETTVSMTGKGLGGRNQHLALECCLLLKEHPGITVLAAGTDGNDGPTDAAGAVVDSFTLSIAARKNLDPLKYLKDFDSYYFFKKAGGHIITGPTMTNVMDIIVVIVE
jgi:glycerate 2-kinase